MPYDWICPSVSYTGFSADALLSIRAMNHLWLCVVSMVQEYRFISALFVSCGVRRSPRKAGEPIVNRTSYLWASDDKPRSYTGAYACR